MRESAREYEKEKKRKGERQREGVFTQAAEHVSDHTWTPAQVNVWSACTWEMTRECRCDGDSFPGRFVTSSNEVICATTR